MKRHVKSSKKGHHVIEWLALGTVTVLVGAVLFAQNTGVAVPGLYSNGGGI